MEKRGYSEGRLEETRLAFVRRGAPRGECKSELFSLAKSPGLFSKKKIQPRLIEA
jgi:hypothetical protein